MNLICELIIYILSFLDSISIIDEITRIIDEIIKLNVFCLLRVKDCVIHCGREIFKHIITNYWGRMKKLMIDWCQRWRGVVLGR